MLKRIILLSGMFFLFLSVSAQQEDFRTWWAAELQGELLNTIVFKVNPEIRFRNNSTELSTIFTDFDVSYSFLKYFKIGGQYRIEKLQFRDGYTVNRFGLYLRAKYKIQGFRFAYRAMYHWEYIGINTREIGNIPIEYHRHKISLKYFKKKWDLRPEVAVEHFVNRRPQEVIYEQKMRVTVGLEYRINKDLSLSLSYKYQEEVFVNNPITAHILATKISYRL